MREHGSVTPCIGPAHVRGRATRASVALRPDHVERELHVRREDEHVAVTEVDSLERRGGQCRVIGPDHAGSSRCEGAERAHDADLHAVDVGAPPDFLDVVDGVVGIVRHSASRSTSGMASTS